MRLHERNLLARKLLARICLLAPVVLDDSRRGVRDDRVHAWDSIGGSSYRFHGGERAERVGIAVEADGAMERRQWRLNYCP